jgi:hypothetical protein
LQPGLERFTRFLALLRSPLRVHHGIDAIVAVRALQDCKGPIGTQQTISQALLPDEHSARLGRKAVIFR